MAQSNLAPLLIAGAVGVGLLAFASATKASGGGAKACPVSVEKLNAWLIEKQLAGNCTPGLTTAPANYTALVNMKLAPAEFVPYALVLGDGSFWYYSTPTGAPAKSANLQKQFQTYLGTLKGHPADTFMVW